MTDAKPFPKAQQLSRGERRYRRKVASPKQWQAIRAAKVDGFRCRVCSAAPATDSHHVVARDHYGDDVLENIVGVCQKCHRELHARSILSGKLLLTSLYDSEYAYMIERGGEDYPERAYGVRYGR